MLLVQLLAFGDGTPPLAANFTGEELGQRLERLRAGYGLLGVQRLARLFRSAASGAVGSDPGRMARAITDHFPPPDSSEKRIQFALRSIGIRFPRSCPAISAPLSSWASRFQA